MHSSERDVSPTRCRVRLCAALAVLTLGGVADAAPAKKAARAPNPKPVERETVFVALAPKAEAKPEPREEPKPLPSREESKPRASYQPVALDRRGGSAVGGGLGLYHAEVLGTTPLVQALSEWFPLPVPIFFQFTGSFGLVQSDVSREVVGALALENRWLFALEALGGYTFDISGRSGKDRAAGLYPYFLCGITVLHQGGVPNFGGVLGVGQRLPLPFVKEQDRLALNLGFKEHIYSQKFRTTPSMTQNFQVTVGLQRYF